jgi:putative membrane protein
MRHAITTVIVAAVLALASPAARAQEMTDQQFVALAAMGGLAEVRLGRLATERAARGSVQQFAERMVADHGAMSADLARLAARKGMSVPVELGAEHQEAMDRLARLSGHDFDRAYMQHMVADHTKDIAHFEHQAQTGIDPDFKGFAADALPVLRQHLEMARSVNTQVVLGPAETVQPAASPMARPVPGSLGPWCAGAYAPRGGTNFGACIAR